MRTLLLTLMLAVNTAFGGVLVESNWNEVFAINESTGALLARCGHGQYVTIHDNSATCTANPENTMAFSGYRWRVAAFTPGYYLIPACVGHYAVYTEGVVECSRDVTAAEHRLGWTSETIGQLRELEVELDIDTAALNRLGL